MYGYIRPLKSELRLREYEQFRSLYCGLCGELRRKYGVAARLAVSYDMTFLAMLYSPKGVCRRVHCPRHPFRRVPCLCGDPALSLAADCTVILGWWKLQDDRQDKHFFASLPARIGCLAMKRAYRQCETAYPEFCRITEACLNELGEMEKDGGSSLDRLADCFARILAAIPLDALPVEEQRISREILYHIGRSIYILDAADDYREDRENDRYNPLITRCSTHELDEQTKSELSMTLNLSQRRIASALELRGSDLWQPILENIVMEGLPAVQDAVLSGRKGRNTIPDKKEEKE